MLISYSTLLFICSINCCVNNKALTAHKSLSVGSEMSEGMATRLPLLIVGLGNPGFGSDGITIVRHNVGEAFANYLQKKNEQPWKLLSSCFANVCEGRKYTLVKPLTYMNDSGKCVKRILEHYNTPPNRLLVVHDDLDCEVGTYHFKSRGSAQGHNGVRSIVNALQMNEFKRLKFGIGRPENREEVSEYVLDLMFVDHAMMLQTGIFEDASQEVMKLVDEEEITYADVVMAMSPNISYPKNRVRNKGYNNYWGKLTRHSKK